MKKIFTAILLFVSFTAYMPITSSKVISVNNDIKALVNDGYSLNWASKKALVESNVIRPDAEYYAIIND